MKTLILGAGKTGKSAFEFLKNQGLNVCIWDDNEKVRESFGTDIFQSFDDISRVILSPGLPILWPFIHPIYKQAKRLCIPIISDIDLLQFSAPKSKYLGITGTNGKSTTTALLGFCLQNLKEKNKVFLGGNLGIPALNLPIIDDGFYVLEMSSYQLEASSAAEFDIGILLNITPDHLDRHGGLAGYVWSKQLIFKGMNDKGWGILGIDEAETLDIYNYLFPLMKDRLIPISTKKFLEKGYCIQGGNILRDGEILWNMNHPHLKGHHNGQNIMAVWATLSILGFTDSQIQSSIMGFSGLDHRQEYVMETPEGLKFINDSKATNSMATIQALNAYCDVHLILGGRSKMGGIEELIPYFSKISHALLIGEAADDFAEILKKHNVPFSITRTLEETLNFNFPQKGIVLFSPACASFDQFNNFEERGNEFKRLVLDKFQGNYSKKLG